MLGFCLIVLIGFGTSNAYQKPTVRIVGEAQMKKLDNRINRKREIALLYKNNLRNVKKVRLFNQDLDNSYWLNTNCRTSNYPLVMGPQLRVGNQTFNGIDNKKAYCYPNPIRYDIGKIRVESLNAEEIKVIIYDLAGYYVAEFKNNNLHSGLQVSEWDWDVSKVESGIYFAHISVNNKKIINTDILKIAVSH